MLIPFDMIAAMLYLGYYAEMPVRALMRPNQSLFAVAVGCAAIFVAALFLNHFVLWRIRRKRPSHTDRRQLATMANLLLRTMLIGVFITVLERSQLPWVVVDYFGWQVGNGDSFLFQLPGLGLYVVLFFAAWLPMYGLHREANWGSWTRISFLVNKARYNLYMLIAWLPFALLADWLSGFIIALPVLFLVAAWTFPWLLARAWGCTKVADDDIMDTVHKLEAMAQARFSRVYMWEPGGGTMQNAAAVGVFPPFRYLFLTPALVRNMPQAELEAVILHELGHVKNKHLLFYMLTSLAGVNLAVLAGALAPLAGTTERFLVTAVLVLFYFRFVFGWLSRNMERQADAFSLEKSGSSSGLVNALEKLAISAGHIRRAASWHHLGVAERVDFLRRADRNPLLRQFHNNHVTRLMVLGYGLSLAILIGMGWVFSQELSFITPAQTQTAMESGETHWRRVMRLMPGNPTAPLELAYQLASDPSRLDEAADLARQVLKLPCNANEKAAAQKLLAELENAAIIQDSSQDDPVRIGLSSISSE